MRRIVLLLFVAGLLFSCATKKAETIPDDQAVKQPEVKQEEAVKPESPVVPASHETVQEASKEMPAEPAPKGIEGIEDIHFDFDKSEVKDPDKAVLKEIADRLTANPDLRVVIEGNCDERGTNVYNIALGERRANAAKSYLMMQGIPSVRIQTVSYGKERPMCREHIESCWSRNRRDHFESAK